MLNWPIAIRYGVEKVFFLHFYIKGFQRIHGYIKLS
jgi:hypothetical protein